MRRRLGLATLGILVATTLTSCGTPESTAGAPTESASPTGAAEPFVPEAGVCHPEVETVGYRALYTVVDCAKVHRTETVHVGTFTGQHADRLAPPPPGSDPMRAAFDDCDTRTAAFVGADWRNGLMTIQVVVPEPRDWTAGSRWYRCDVFTLPALDGVAGYAPADLAVERAGTLRGALTKPSPLAHGCFYEDKYKTLEPIPCTKRHRFEYVGVWTAPDGPYEQVNDDPDAIHDECGTVVADYVAKAPEATFPREIGTAYRFPSPQAWERGDRGIRCFYWSPERNRTRSLLKG
ncbi:hypothetical protein E1091_03325 [Micromonospora fluostatini]|uniref:Septum formation-related domain-containing protein n=1 Tax=Micromonospora fluostatini TaxID=1629071 RepID=A0ABY2DKZ9_9ACTN|nr:hypothetical protein E1091_03325 [Micromonospora fluostatini]